MVKHPIRHHQTSHETWSSLSRSPRPVTVRSIAWYQEECPVTCKGCAQSLRQLLRFRDQLAKWCQMVLTVCSQFTVATSGVLDRHDHSFHPATPPDHFTGARHCLAALQVNHQLLRVARLARQLQTHMSCGNLMAICEGRLRKVLILDLANSTITCSWLYFWSAWSSGPWAWGQDLLQQLRVLSHFTGWYLRANANRQNGQQETEKTYSFLVSELDTFHYVWLCM